MLTHFLPCPPTTGAKTRTYHVLHQLSKRFRISLLPFYRIMQEATQHDANRLSHGLAGAAALVAEPIPVPGDTNPGRRLIDHLRSLATRRPYSHFKLLSKQYRAALERTLSRDRPDLIHLDSPDLSPYVEGISRIPVACTHHDIEWDLLARRATLFGNPLIRAYLRFQSRITAETEGKYARGFDLNVVMSELDGRRLREMAPGARFVVAPNGVDVDQFGFGPMEKRNSETVLFVGPTYIFQNRDAAEFLLGNIWPLVRALRPNATLQLIGKGTQALSDASRGVSGLGCVDQVMPHLCRARVAVAPVRVGGGTRLKIVEAWSCGTPVVSTTLGAEGLEAVHTGNALLANEAEPFARAIVQLIESPALAEKLGRQGRLTAEARYSWSSIGERLLAEYERLTARRDRSAMTVAT